jgi:membrane protein YdbS with pleckstrin-like domain
MAMPIGSQPKRAQGTIGHPYSALNLRLVLAIFGLVAFVALAVLFAVIHLTVAAVVSAIVAATAVVDIVVIQMRRRARAREEGGEHHSLFE